MECSPHGWLKNQMQNVGKCPNRGTYKHVQAAAYTPKPETLHSLYVPSSYCFPLVSVRDFHWVTILEASFPPMPGVSLLSICGVLLMSFAHSILSCVCYLKFAREEDLLSPNCLTHSWVGCQSSPVHLLQCSSHTVVESSTTATHISDH